MIVLKSFGLWISARPFLAQSQHAASIRAILLQREIGLDIWIEKNKLNEGSAIFASAECRAIQGQDPAQSLAAHIKWLRQAAWALEMQLEKAWRKRDAEMQTKTENTTGNIRLRMKQLQTLCAEN